MYKDKMCKMEGCTNIFTPTSGSQKYCDSCKGKAKQIREKIQWRNQSRKRNNYTEITKKCKFCGKEFSTYYKKQVTCGSEECEKARVLLKNKISHKNRDKKDLLLKSKLYYKNNRKKCLESKGVSYRINHKDAKPYVFGRVYKHSIEYIRNYVQKRGYILLSTEYINSNSKLTLKCPEGHIWKTNFHSFMDNKNKTGNRCAVCYAQNNYVSRPEQLIRDFLEEELPDIKVVYNDRFLIKPKELDFYFPDNNLAVEVCGLYWHGELSSGRSRTYHYDKMKSCLEKNVRLITIFEDELINNKDIILSRICQALGVQKKRIFARKCKLVEIDSKTANLFFKANHTQGSSTALVRYGLFFNDELVCVGSLGKILRKHTSQPTTIEFKRFCTLINVSVIGGIGKIFKQMKIFAKDNDYKEIRSYCDMRYANIFNTVYEVLGFNLLTYTKYTPHYFMAQKRYRNYSLRKTFEERQTGKTEWELRKEQGYDRIWDCGHRTYVCGVE